MSEEWRPVSGFEGSYEVSSHGRVRSLGRWIRANANNTHRFCEGKMLDGWVNKHGYRMVSLWRDNEATEIFVHRLVCEAFHGPRPSEEHEVAHNDGDPANSRFDNLRWATHAENMGDKRLHGTHTCGERHSRAKLTLVEVKQILASSARNGDLALAFDVSPATICDIKKGRSWREALETAQ